MANNQTQNGGPATTEQQTSAAAANAGTNNDQATQVVADTQDGNSDSSDGNNGSSEDNDSNRNRPSRSERRIGALHGELAEALQKAATAEEEANKLRAQLEQPIGDRVKMPDYSNVEQVTPEQLKQDIINTADQIVKIRLEEGLRQNSQTLTQRESNNRVLDDIDGVIKDHPELNPNNDETYDEDLEKYLVGSFQRAYRGDNTYRLKEHVDQYFKQNKGKPNTNQSTNDDRSRGAVRSTASRSNSGGKTPQAMSSTELLAYIRGGGKV